MIQLILIVYVVISVYMFLIIELGMCEIEKNNNGKFKLSQHLSALFISCIPILNVYILYKSKFSN